MAAMMDRIGNSRLGILENAASGARFPTKLVTLAVIDEHRRILGSGEDQRRNRRTFTRLLTVISAPLRVSSPERSPLR